MKKTILLILCSSFLFSCFEKETPRPMPHIPGEVTRAQIFIESDYKYQVFYNLQTGTEVARNLKTDWDFAINQETIILNSSKFMTAAITTESELSQVSSKAGYTFLPDKPSAYIEDLSIGKWQKNTVYLLDRGFDALGKQLGYAKLIVYTEDQKVYVEYSLLASKESKKLEVAMEDNFTFVSIDKGQQNIAPVDNNWHLCFTQYTHLFEDGTPYLVTGVLINANNTQGIEFSDSSFQNINLHAVKELSFLDSANVIGYDWKIYSFETSSFITDINRNFVLKTAENYYKLHFLDFYNEKGEKGNFYVEYQKL